MKWLITVSRYLPEKVGGNFTYIQQFSNALVNSGDQVHIVTTTLKKDLAGVSEENGLTIHRILLNRGNMGPIWFNHSSLVTEYISQLDKKERFDCINLHTAFMVNTSKLRKELFILYTLHAVVSYEYLFKLKKLLPKTFKEKSAFSQLLQSPILIPLSFIREWIHVRRANHIVVMSNYVKGTIKTFLPGIDLNKVTISRIGIDNSFKPAEDKNAIRNSLNILETDIALLTVRRLESRMGIDNLISAMNLLNQLDSLKNVKLFIAGKGSLYDSFQKRIKDYGLEKNIQLLGFVSDEDLRTWYQASNAFVMPTEELEGFGIVTIEAFASGLPVIATPAGANPEVAGKFCPELLATNAKSPKAIANAIMSFISNSESYKSKNYSIKAKAYYNWNDITENIRQLINIRHS